jgi:ABC-type multidrug transport system ATPase subunit
MQKRVGLARALALDPDLLLFDEPTAGLDPITAAEIGELILRLKKERNLTSVVVTHDVHGAKSFADHVILLRAFFKNRGYEDASDLTKHAIANLPSGEPAKVFEYDGQKIFNEQAKLKDQKSFKDAGDYLQTNKFGLAVVAVSVGMKGETDQDQVLSEGRAAVIRDYLAKNFRLDDTDQNSWPRKIRRYRRQWQGRHSGVSRSFCNRRG